MIEKLKSIGETILGIAVFVGIIFLTFLLLQGAVIISEKAIPFLVNFTHILTAILIFILVPMAFYKRTREWSGAGMILFSYGFGLTLWFYSALVAYVLWGLIALFIGLAILGVGVFPVALLATIFNGEWMILGSLVYMFVLTFGSRFLGLYIAEKVEEKEYQNMDEYQLENENVKVNDAEIEESFNEVETADNRKVYCEKCGKEVLPESNFCKYCGNKLK